MSGFELIPAIDLLGGQCVRLVQGRYDAATVYDADPAAVPARFAAHPLRRLHVADPGGARLRGPGNAAAVRTILAAAPGVPLELGGGLRTLAAVEAWLALGVERVVLGTAALHDPALVKDAARRFPGRVAVGIDARDGRVAVSGSLENYGADALAAALRVEEAGDDSLVASAPARTGTGARA